MKYSAKCITYGRTHLLVEALYSFLIQDYPENESEMVIVNDYPLQKLVFDHPRVRIYNLDKTFDTIGEKENFAIERCSGDIIMVADDDDIQMPWHLQNVDKYWKEDTNLLFWNNAVFYNEPTITEITQVGNSGIVYSKKAWESIGKSPLENAGGDMTLVSKIIALNTEGVVYAHPPNKEVSHWYRWSLPQNYHQSGQGTDTPNKPNIVERNALYVEGQRKLGKIPTGTINLVPKWRYDYLSLFNNYLKKHTAK